MLRKWKLVLLGIGLILIWYFVSIENLDLRSYWLIWFFDGGGFIIGLIFLVLSWILKRGKIFHWVELTLAYISMLGLYFLLILSLVLGNGVKKDELIYLNGKEEKLIVQSYFIGLTGNPRMRVIKVKWTLSSQIRNIEEIKIPIELGKIDFSDSISEMNVPRIIYYQEDQYLLNE